MENRSGALLRVLEMLRDNGISIVVSTLGDTDGFGIYRVICNDTEKAFKLLRDKNISATITNVYALRLAATHRRKPSHGMDKEMQASERGAQKPALCAHGKMFHPQTGGNHPETPGRTVRKD